MIKKDKQPSIWNWKFILGGIGLIIGLVLAGIGTVKINSVLMLFGIVAGALSAWLAYKGYKAKDEYYEKPKEKERQTGPIPNCIVVRPGSVEAIYMENAPGMLRKCFNNGRRYHLLEQESKGERDKLKDIILPDDDKSKIYYNPKEFGNAASMPSNKQYFQWSATIFQKIAVGVMAIIIIAEIIGLVVLGG
jgi:hypothetical protein